MTVREIYKGPDFRSGNEGKKGIVDGGDGEGYTPLIQAAAFAGVSEEVMKFALENGMSLDVAEEMLEGIEGVGDIGLTKAENIRRR